MNARKAMSAERRSARGFTLLELLIAIALMAVLALLGWQGLDSVLRSRERIAEASDGLRALSLAFTQLEDDLRRTWGARLLELRVPTIAFVAEQEDGPPTLQLLRELPPDSGPRQVQRVAYRVRGGVWERGFGDWTMPAPTGDASAAGASAVGTPMAAAPGSPMIWQALIDDVANLQLRAYVVGAGWVPAAGLLLRPGVAPSGLQVVGIEALIQRRNGERVLRVLTVKD